MPANLRPTTRECVHLITRGHFQSGDKDGGHIIRSSITENPKLCANFTVIERGFMPISYIGEMRIFCLLTFSTLTDTFICELDLYFLKIYQMSENELLTSRFT